MQFNFIPTEISITKRVTYQILWCDEFPDHKTHITRGLCDLKRKYIILKRGMSKAKTYQTYIHEVIHAFLYENKLDIPHRMIHKLELPLYKFLKVNGFF